MNSMLTLAEDDCHRGSVVVISPVPFCDSFFVGEQCPTCQLPSCRIDKQTAPIIHLQMRLQLGLKTAHLKCMV